LQVYLCLVGIVSYIKGNALFSSCEPTQYYPARNLILQVLN